jgi:hypothetical protein
MTISQTKISEPVLRLIVLSGPSQTTTISLAFEKMPKAVHGLYRYKPGRNPVILLDKEISHDWDTCLIIINELIEQARQEVQDETRLLFPITIFSLSTTTKPVEPVQKDRKFNQTWVLTRFRIIGEVAS